MYRGGSEAMTRILFTGDMHLDVSTPPQIARKRKEEFRNVFEQIISLSMANEMICSKTLRNSSFRLRAICGGVLTSRCMSPVNKIRVIASDPPRYISPMRDFLKRIQ